jgi:hypothetical protein
MKEKLINYLESFKNIVNTFHVGDKKINNIELFSGVKPTMYHVPIVFDYLNHPPYSNRGGYVGMSWFVEIWIDGLCIWRKEKSGDGDLNKYEDELIENTLEEIVFCGLNSSWESIINIHKHKTT